MRPGLCRYTSPNGTLRRSVWNQPAVTITFSMRSHVSTRHPPNATTSARRARSRHANTTASSITAPTYAPGAEPNASGQAAQTPFVASGRSVTCAVERTGCPSASYPRCRLDEPMNARRGIRIARLASGIAIRNSARASGGGPSARPRRARTDATDVATRNAASSSEHITSPWLMCALATCDHANADEARATPGGATTDRRGGSPMPPPARPWSRPGSRRTASRSPCPMSTSASPGRAPPPSPTGRENDSLRRNQNRPSPPSNGFRTMSARIAAPGDSVENRSIGGTYSQPLCGSAANR